MGDGIFLARPASVGAGNPPGREGPLRHRRPRDDVRVRHLRRARPERDGAGGGRPRGCRLLASSARPTCTSSPTARPPRTRTSAPFRIPPRPDESPVGRAAARRRRLRPGLRMRRSAPIRRARSGSPRRVAESSASSRAMGSSRSSAAGRSPRASTPAGRWRGMSPAARTLLGHLVPELRAGGARVARGSSRSGSPGRSSPTRSCGRRVEGAAALFPRRRIVELPFPDPAVYAPFMREVADVHRELFAQSRGRLRRRRSDQARALLRRPRLRGRARGSPAGGVRGADERGDVGTRPRSSRRRCRSSHRRSARAAPAISRCASR